MSSSNRRTLLLGLAALAGCGYEPVYAPGAVARDLRGAILVDPPSDPTGFVFVNELERRLGEPQAPRYRLTADLAVVQDNIGITADQEITRFRLRGRADYAVLDPATGGRLFDGRAEGFTTYSATATTVATRSARRDAETRLMVILADQIVTRLTSTAGDWA
ncbi:MAG: LPS assembly lipoprotein LptE [Paracoccaceae bacterium]|nr:LPS assembly lipoprotein LptE [Paracoccaceae bacterium]